MTETIPKPPKSQAQSTTARATIYVPELTSILTPPPSVRPTSEPALSGREVYGLD